MIIPSAFRNKNTHTRAKSTSIQSNKDNYRITGQYPTVMDVRMIIMSHPDGSAQVGV
jgi:hypothetical protein